MMPCDCFPGNCFLKVVSVFIRTTIRFSPGHQGLPVSNPGFHPAMIHVTNFAEDL